MTTRTVKLYKEHIPLTRIDWQLLASAVQFYEVYDFQYVELPYIVPTSINNITFDGRGYDVSSLHSLVGSAEQSFLNDAVSPWRDHDVPPGRYVGCTPCFRREDTHTALHQPHFMKVELFQVPGEDRETDAYTMMMMAREFMRANCSRPVLVEQTKEGWDLVVDGLEVGSYGVRQHGDFLWAYGTGLALPRFSQAQRLS